MSMPQHVLIVAGAPVHRPQDYAETIRAAELIVAVDAGAELCRAVGRWPDHLVGDLDSVSPETLREAECAATVVHSLNARKDYSDLDAALELCESLVPSRPLTVIAASHGRPDHFLAVCGSLARHASMCPVIEEPDMQAWILDPSGCTSLTLCPLGGVFSVLALLGPCTVSIEGARYPLATVEIDALSAHGLSNVIADKSATVTVHAGTIMVISPRDSDSPFVVQNCVQFA